MIEPMNAENEADPAAQGLEDPAENNLLDQVFLKPTNVSSRKYELFYNQDGIFLRVFTGAAGKDMEDCLKILKRKGLQFVSDADIDALFESADETLHRIADPREEKILDEEMVVSFSDRNMTASMELMPPDPNGVLLNSEKIVENLRETYKITFGIDLRAISDLLTNRLYYEPVVIARGREPVRGADGELTYHFAIEKNEKTYKIEDDGRINFRERNKIESVKEGQVLVSRTLAGLGENGVDVLGKPLPATKGREIALPSGKNVGYSEDKLSLLAKINGHIEIINEKVFISPTYIIRGDVDMKVGNVDFDGDVLITGNVNSEFIIKATGNVTVNGVVEAAYIESGADIILKKGIQGADKGMIRAKGSLYALFIHRTDVEVENKIVADIILHSKIKCEGEVDLTDKNGLLVGGSMSVGKTLIARTIGAESGVSTKIKLGISPKKRERYFQIGEDLSQIRSGIERMDRALKSTVGQLTGMEIRMEVTRKMLALKKEQIDLEKELQELETQIAQSKDGNVHVLSKVYPGTRISIGASIYDVKSEEAYVTYHIRNGFIATESCKYRLKP